MDIAKALVFVQEYMTKNAKVVAAQMTEAGLVPAYRAKAHSAAAGRVMSHLAMNGVDELEMNAVNMTTLFHSLANHSAWRQKFEAAGIFPKAQSDGKVVDPAKAQDKVAKMIAALEKEQGAAMPEMAQPTE